MKNKERLLEIARGSIERHLGDCESPDDLYDNAYTLAFDALHDAGVSGDLCRSIAQEIAMCYAQP